jgi:tRNA modification GTPase
MDKDVLQNNTDTIVAIATATGRAGVGVVRLSGGDLQPYIDALLGAPKTLTPRHAHYGSFYDKKGHILDQGLLLLFPAPQSFTGENVLEIHGHGGPVVLDSLVQRCLDCGARLARPGEFSERAFLNDKMDLAQAEAIADLIDAASSQSARSALRSLQGEFSNLIGELVKQMINVRVYVEAAIDFPEEEIDFLADNTLKENLHGLVESLLQIQDRAQQGSLLRDGIKVVLAGKPNAGKSSLLNALAEQDAAIVTPVAGTTRDVLREQIHLEGVPLNIVDTAGLRETDDQVEMQGVQRAWKEIEEADAILYVVDITTNNPIDIKILWPEYFERFPNAYQTIITLLNKVDLCDDPDIKKTPNSVIQLSAKTGQGLDLLKSRLLSSAGFNTSSEGVFSARRRHLSAIANALELLRTGINQLEGSGAGELLAEDLRQAQQYLSEITGDFSSDDLLGEIFSSFCIGK